MAITTNNLISRQTVGSAGAASITFSNIPQTFTDLRLVSSLRGDANTVDMTYTFNGLTSNQSQKLLRGNGTAAASGTDTNIYGLQNASTYTASTFSNQEIYIPNYTSANYKSMSLDGATENNATTSYTYLVAQLWSATAAITSIGLVAGSSGNFEQYSTFSLYGISSNTSTQNTSIPSATGGDVITTDGTYWIHQFLYSGTFTPLKALTADYLVVAGGGGAGGNGSPISWGGGAGAGGLRSTVTATGGGGSLETALSLTTTGYTVTIGAGGTGAGSPTNGSNSVFSSITSTGGGASGVGGNGVNGSSGGSGGGATGAGAATGGARTASPVQGFAGGNSNATYGGGGGGAAAVGTVATVDNVAGGAGAAVSISGSSVTYAAGGNGGTATTPYSRVANSGSGGQGMGAGGSGIVIVRYAV